MARLIQERWTWRGRKKDLKLALSEQSMQLISSAQEMVNIQSQNLMLEAIESLNTIIDLKDQPRKEQENAFEAIFFQAMGNT
jgi:hypothetical protein